MSGPIFYSYADNDRVMVAKYERRRSDLRSWFLWFFLFLFLSVLVFIIYTGPQSTQSTFMVIIGSIVLVVMLMVLIGSLVELIGADSLRIRTDGIDMPIRRFTDTIHQKSFFVPFDEIEEIYVTKDDRILIKRKGGASSIYLNKQEFIDLQGFRVAIERATNGKITVGDERIFTTEKIRPYKSGVKNDLIKQNTTTNKGDSTPETVYDYQLNETCPSCRYEFTTSTIFEKGDKTATISCPRCSHIIKKRITKDVLKKAKKL